MVYLGCSLELACVCAVEKTHVISFQTVHNREAARSTVVAACFASFTSSEWIFFVLHAALVSCSGTGVLCVAISTPCLRVGTEMLGGVYATKGTAIACHW